MFKRVQPVKGGNSGGNNSGEKKKRLPLPKNFKTNSLEWKKVLQGTWRLCSPDHSLLRLSLDDIKTLFQEASLRKYDRGKTKANSTYYEIKGFLQNGLQKSNIKIKGHPRKVPPREASIPKKFW